MKNKVLLLGNGLNDVINNYKWSNLIEDLRNELNLININLDPKKPFPLLYEEIYLTGMKNKLISELRVKEFIAQKTKEIKSNDIHRQLSSIGFSEILTTNYDYTIEKSINKNNEIFSNAGIVTEKRYSLFRHTLTDGLRVWHIHGELDIPKSILLGYEHYSGQLQKIRNYVVSGTGNAYKIKFSPLIKRLKQNDLKYHSWIDLFFTKEIYIIGLTLDFVESDLWLLITYRARKKLENESLITNNIYYYYPKEFENKIQFKLDILKSCEVKTRHIDIQHSLSYYKNIVDSIRSEAT